MIKISDQLGRALSFENIPQRIISLVPSQTELLVDLGLEEQLLGITKFCVHPVHLREEKMIVGGTKKVRLEKIKALDPDIIFCNKEENTLEMVQELEKIAPVHVSDVKNINDTLELIRQYGEIFGVEEKANHLLSEISEGLSDFQEYVKDQPVKRVAYFIWKDPWMVAGGDTFIDQLLKLNRYQNSFSQEEGRYPEVDLKSIRSKEVELVLLSTEPYPFNEEHRAELQRNFKECRIYLVDGEFFSWYGSRLRIAFSYFKSLRAS